jgi:hypothetical protein
MARGIPNAKQKGLEDRLKPTGMQHIFYFDALGDGRLKEVAVVKMDRTKDGSVLSVYYIDVSLLDNIDKGRLKTIVTSRHADKYELWDLLSQSTLSNGKNALDYFHQLTKVEHGQGAVTTGFSASLANVPTQGESIVGSEFSDPTSAALDTQAAN